MGQRVLRHAGFPIERVIATDNAGTVASPKATALRDLRPVAFVDDFLPYLRGIPAGIHAALVLREPNGSPNAGDDLVWAHSRHAHLADFTIHELVVEPVRGLAGIRPKNSRK